MGSTNVGELNTADSSVVADELFYGTTFTDGSGITTEISTTSNQFEGVVIFLLLILVVATCGMNIIVMLCIAVDKTLRGKSYWYIFSLAIADFIVGVICMGPFLVYFVSNLWPFGKTLCTAWICIDYSIISVSVNHVCLISYDRYMALVQPIKYKDRATNNVLLQMFMFMFILFVSQACTKKVKYLQQYYTMQYESRVPTTAETIPLS
jgi:hypothetical protein